MGSLTAAAEEARAALVRLDGKEREEGGAGGGGRGVVSDEPRSLFVPSYIKNEAMANPIQTDPNRSQLVIYDEGYRKKAEAYLNDDRVGNRKMSDQIWTPRQLEEIGNCLVVDPIWIGLSSSSMTRGTGKRRRPT